VGLLQVKLQLEIIRGSKVKKALVEFAAKRDASKLVLGSCNKHFIIGWVHTLLNHTKTHHSFNVYSCIPPA
jgi:hypothetical protein